jgi:superoxide dismutase, Cu-Zn family
MKSLIASIGIVVGASMIGWAAVGTAEIKGTETNSLIKGTASFEDTAAGLHVKAQLIGVPAGAHGFHIHEYGSCDQMAKAAGGHYNPFGATHGDVMKAGLHHAHAGDLGNVTAQADGSATLDLTIPGLTLVTGANTVAGRSVVLHEKVDDLTTQPAGNAGARIACGSILLSGAGTK